MATQTGGCHCGAIRYEVRGDPVHSALCHCSDCRKAAGAPAVAWTAFSEENVTLLSGSPRERNSSGASVRSFCGDCGTGLFFRNVEVMPGLVDVQSATLDDPEVLPPQVHIQTAERLGWMTGLDALPAFERFPSG